MDTMPFVEKLREQVNKRVRMRFTDGEDLVADLGLVLEDENAVVFDLVASNRPEKYEKSDKRPHIFAKIDDILSCEVMEAIPDGGGEPRQ